MDEESSLRTTQRSDQLKFHLSTSSPDELVFVFLLRFEPLSSPRGLNMIMMMILMIVRMMILMMLMSVIVRVMISMSMIVKMPFEAKRKRKMMSPVSTFASTTIAPFLGLASLI